MAKAQYALYTRPLLKNFQNKNFLNKSKLLLPFIRDTLLKRVRHLEDGHWVFVNPTSSRPKGWTPKLYVCVAPQDFWSVVGDLISITREEKLTWKFCKNFKFFARPDKIVIYPVDLKDLKRIIRILRPRLKGKHFHGLQSASSTVQSGLEKKGSGLFVGTDPAFLKGVSWGYYRWAIEEGIIKANKKMDNNTKLIIEKLNVTLKHRGPRSFNPNKKNISLVRQIWKQLSS